LVLEISFFVFLNKASRLTNIKNKTPGASRAFLMFSLVRPAS